MIPKFAAIYGSLALLMLTFSVKAQTTAPAKVKTTLIDGIVIAGYADHGGYINFTGPGIRFTRKPLVLVAGLLPSLKIKEDEVPAGATKNSTLTPTLGFGLTAAFKHFAVQVPLYYTGKTSAADGKWKAGAGIGYKF